MHTFIHILMHIHICIHAHINFIFVLIFAEIGSYFINIILEIDCVT